MAKTSTKRRNILIASLIVVVLVVSSIGAVIYLLTYDNVTVSGIVGVSSAVVIAPTVQTIEFQTLKQAPLIHSTLILLKKR